MSAYSSVLGVAVLFLHLWGTHSFPTSTCPVPCLCQRGPLLNCSSLGLTEIPTRIPGTAVSLNISNNALRSLAPLSFGHVKLKRLLHLWVGSNALESLSLILKKDRSGTRTLTSGQQECTSWAPDLQLLSAERNHLKHLPKGLGCIKSLQILQLSYNQISEIGLTDLDNCIHLKELHLQHNNITSIHQHAFVNLKHLQVLDLSYNMLVTIPVPAYQSLRNLNALVDVSFNRWKCDCNLQTLRRWISFDTEIGDASWQVVCASPPHHAGKDLLHLKDSELTCPTHEYSTSGRYHNMIVDEGMQISIPCSNDSQDIMQVHWWTPQGQVRDNQPKLIIKDITEQQAGLYVCVSGLQGEHISVFDLHVYKKGSGSRSRREAATILNEQENTNAPRNVLRQRTESNFVLAVCLSVIITFIVAFILGVLLRPLLDKLWMRIRSKRRSTTPTTTTTSSAGPQPYVNEGYSDVEDQEVRSGSRVTFGGITEVEVPYYVTVENNQADGSSESNTEVEPQYETVKKNESSITGGKRQALERETHRGRADSSSSSSLQEGEVNALVINGKKLPTYSTKNMAKSMEFEPIPDANDITELKRRGSSSSSSSQSSQEGNFSRESEQSVDPPAVTIPGNKNTMGRIPGFSTDPFPERPNRLTELNVDELDPELWNDSGESFSFNESSERSSIRDLSNSALGHPLKDDFDKPFGKELNVDDNKQLNRSNRVSSSSSSESVESIDGPNKYVVNPEEMDKSDIENYANSATLNRFGSLKDVTLNERMPSAGILIRQEAVTHDSVDDNMHIYDISDKPGVCVDVGLDTVPKVKRYIEFKQFKPHSGPPTLPSFSSSSTKNTLPDKITLPSLTTKDAIQETRRYSSSSSSSSEDGELTTEEDNFFRKIGVSSDGVAKVKRFITFKQFEPSSPLIPSFTKKDEMLEAKSYSSSSDDDDDHHLTTKSHNVDVSSVGVSNVKRYSSSSDDDDDPLTTKGDNEDVSSVRVSKVKRYITFKQFESPSPSPPSFTKKDEMLVAKSYSSSSDDDDDHHLTTKSHKVDVSSVGVSNVKRYSSSSDDDDPLTTKGDNVDVSSVRVSKVKRYITFKQFESRSPSPPSFTKKDEMLVAKSYSSSSDDDDDHHLTTKSHNVDVSSVGVSNVKRYSSSSDDDDDDDPLTTKGDNVDVSSVRVSKVKRYITFKQFESPSPSPPSFTKKDEMLVAKSYSSSSDDDDDHHLTTKSHKVDVSSVGVSNVKRYSSSSDDDDPLTTKGDNVDVSSVGVSKVKRYISFTQLESSSPTLSVSRPSTRIETTTEETIQSVQPSTTPKDTSPNAKKYMYLKHQHQSSSLPSSPTSTRKGLSGKIKRKKQNDQSYSGSQDSLPLYHVHPVYRSSINRLNRGYDTDRSYSSEEEDQFSEYPIEFTMASGINSGSITPDKKADKVLNIDFDNSSSSTDVFDKKHSKGLLKLRALNARLFNRHENETDEGNLQSQVETKSSTVSRNRKPKVTTNENENGLSLDHLPNVKRYLQFSHSDSYQVQLPSPPPTTGVVTPEFIVTTESRRSSSSSEDDVQLRSTPTIGVVTPGFIGTTESRRSSSSSEDDVKLPSLPPSTEVVTPRFIETTESRRSSSSSEDDVKETTEDINFVGQVGASYDRIPKVKRYIKFSSTEPSLTTLPLNKELGAKPESWRSSTSSEDDIKLSTNEDNFFGKIGVSHDTVPNVKRYIQFSQPKPYSPTLTSSSISTKRPAVVVETSSKTSVKLDDKPDATEKNLGGQIDLDAVSKVKRYVQFTQYKHHSPTLPSPPSLTMKDAIQETRRYSSSSSSSSSDELTTEKDNFFRKIGVASDGVSKVKRFITFKQFEPSSPTLPVSKIEATTETVTSTLTSTSKDDVRSQNENEEIGISLERVPRVKRYIQFKQPVSHLPVVSPTTSDKLQVTPRVETKSEARRSSSSSEDDVKPTAKVDNVFGQTGTSLDRVPRVRRYIQFTRPEIQSPVQTTTSLSSERVIVTTVAKETRRWSTSSSEEDVKLTTKKENIREETGEYLPKIPKVKRYIKFTQPEPYTSNLSPFRPLSTEKYTKVTETKLKPPATRDSTSSEDDVQEDNGSGQTGVSLNRVSRVKRYIQFTHTESQPPTQSASSVSAQRLGVLGAVQDTRRSSSSSEDDDDKPSIRETGESLDKIPKVKSYIQFTQYEPSAQSKLPSSSVAKSIKVTAIPTTNENKTESMTQITSSGSVDRVTRVKRYIQFTPTESQYPSWASTAVWAERVEISGVAQETKIPSTSAEYVKPNYSITGKTDTSFFQETGVSLDKIPKVNRYIAFTKNEPSSTKLMKRDLTPATQWSSLSSEMSPPASLKKGSALIIKTQSQSWKSESNSAEQTGLKSKLRKSSSSSSDESIGHNVVDVQALQDEPPAVPLTSPPPLEQENAREYLRENSEVRQRQERRRLQQQRRREMDEFDIASLSSMQQEGDKQNRSPADYGVTPFQTEHAYSNVFTSSTLSSRSTEGAEAPVLRGLKTKSTSTPSSKTPTSKYREYLI
ncbi:uncharacterized protein LOC127182720 isoform X5 [Labeo rohita]|uniref:uncharacterized protein LOC127182720 isoform X5 n=1 Tax=Labeo rohita TaxID=84645 RepID=UPI0021E2CE76|nr:uncharacterized protein LOC127182720 isoform X5 [Labeo rohita]